MDVASLTESHQSVSRRRRFFNSFRRRFRGSDKTKDKNENLKKSLSQSQPNILHSTPNTNYVELDYEPSIYRSTYQDSFDADSLTPPRTRSMSQHNTSHQTSDLGSESTPPRLRSRSQYPNLQQQASFSDGSNSPPRSRSQSQHASLPFTSSEEYDRDEKEENDSAIDVIEISPKNTQVKLCFRTVNEPRHVISNNVVF